MQSTDIPARFVAPFAHSAGGSYIRAIPTTTGDANAASIALGFPPNNFVDEGAGGVPPDGRDMNGILNQTSAWDWWQSAGGMVPFDSTFSTAVGGYPKFALLRSTSLGVVWQSQVENNTVNPDSGPSANWSQLTALNGTPNDESVTLPNGKILKDGALFSTLSSGSTYTVTFATAFPNACRSAVVVAINSSALATMDVFVQIVSWDRFGVTFVVQDTNTASTHFINGVTFDAKGY